MLYLSWHQGEFTECVLEWEKALQTARPQSRDPHKEKTSHVTRCRCAPFEHISLRLCLLSTIYATCTNATTRQTDSVVTVTLSKQHQCALTAALGIPLWGGRVCWLINHSHGRWSGWALRRIWLDWKTFRNGMVPAVYSQGRLFKRWDTLHHRT